MVPVGRLIVVRNTSKDKLMKAISTITWPAIVVPVVGPSLGGFITTYFSWHWIFLINVPFGLAALSAVLALVPNERSSDKRPLDLVGFFLSGLALTSLLYGTELASHTEVRLIEAFLFIGVGIVLGVLSYRHGMRSPHPLLDYSTLRVKTFSATIVTGSFTRIGIEAVPYLLPLMFQIGFGLSAFQSGLLLLASAVGNLGMKIFTTRILQRFGFRRVTLVNGSIAGVFVLACGLLMPSTPVAFYFCLWSGALDAVLHISHIGLCRCDGSTEKCGQHTLECGAANDNWYGNRIWCARFAHCFLLQWGEQ